MAYLSSLALLAMGKEFCSGLLAQAEQGLSLAGLTAVQLAHGSTWHAVAQACLPNPRTQLSRHRLWVSTLRGPPVLPPSSPQGWAPAAWQWSRLKKRVLLAEILGSCLLGLLTSALLTSRLPRTS